MYIGVHKHRFIDIIYSLCLIYLFQTSSKMKLHLYIILWSSLLNILFLNNIYGQEFILEYNQNGHLTTKKQLSQGPNLQINGAEQICEGAQLNWAASGGQTYQWSNGQAGANLNITPTNSGSYTVTTTDANGCTAELSRNITLVAPPNLGFIQQLSPDGNTGPINFGTTSIADANYIWSITEGAIIDGQGTAEVQVQWDNETIGELSVYAITIEGCESEVVTFITAGDDEQFISLDMGWNLVSTYIAPFNYNVESVFGVLTQENVLERVKSIDQLYNPTIPIGNSLEEIENGAGYWVKVNQPTTWHVAGIKLNPLNSPISLNAGWNLVGYIPSQAYSVSEALASIMADVSFVKNIFASYDPAAPPVFNTLQEMNPGQAYWIKMNAPRVLTYPMDNFNSETGSRFNAPRTDLEQMIHVYPGSTAAYGLVTLDGNPVEENNLIIAMVEDEIRGTGRTIEYEEQSYVTMVLNGVASEEMSFYLVQDHNTLTSSFILETSPGQNLEGFLPLAFGETTTIDPISDSKFVSKLYPNPSNGAFKMEIDLVESSILKVLLYSPSGQGFEYILPQSYYSSGSHMLDLNLETLDLASGVYLIQVKSTLGTAFHQLILQK